MTKASGIGWTTMDVDDVTGTVQHIKNDVTNLQFATPRAPTDVTGLDMAAIERLLLLADFTVTLNGQFNPSPGGSHQTLKHVCTAAIVRTTTMVVNAATLANEVLYSDYSVARAQGGDLNWTATGALADGTVPTWS